jgi:hypothetical protein
LATVHAALNYLAPTAQPVHTYAYDPPGGGPRFNGTLVSHLVPIEDAREFASTCSLASSGFALCDAPSDVQNFWDESQLARTAYPEAEALVRSLTGAQHARVFDHTLRRRAAHKPVLDGVGGSFASVRTPVGRVHADYTPYSGPLRLRQVLGETAASAALRGRWWIIGVWRPLLGEALQDAPLAIADARSVRRADLVANDLIYPDRRGQTYAVLHRQRHRWCWFPQQQRNEVIAFVHYASASGEAACTGATPHTAFENPLAPADAPPRESLEMRVLAWCEGA